MITVLQRFTSKGFVLSSSFFSEEGFSPANEAPGMPSSVRITESFTALLEDAILGRFSSDKTRISYTVEAVVSGHLETHNSSGTNLGKHFFCVC